jgi:hypothetical protein
MKKTVDGKTLIAATLLPLALCACLGCQPGRKGGAAGNQKPGEVAETTDYPKAGFKKIGNWWYAEAVSPVNGDKSVLFFLESEPDSHFGAAPMKLCVKVVNGDKDCFMLHAGYSNYSSTYTYRFDSESPVSFWELLT